MLLFRLFKCSNELIPCSLSGPVFAPMFRDRKILISFMVLGATSSGLELEPAYDRVGVYRTVPVAHWSWTFATFGLGLRWNAT